MSSRSGINFKKEMHRLVKRSKHPMFAYKSIHDNCEFSPMNIHSHTNNGNSDMKANFSDFISRNSSIIASAAIGIIGAAAIGMSMQRAPKKKGWISVIGKMM